MGKHSVSDEHICTSFCPAQPKIKISTNFRHQGPCGPLGHLTLEYIGPDKCWTRKGLGAFGQNKVEGLWLEIRFAENFVTYGIFGQKQNFRAALWMLDKIVAML